MEHKRKDVERWCRITYKRLRTNEEEEVMLSRSARFLVARIMEITLLVVASMEDTYARTVAITDRRTPVPTFTALRYL